MAVSPVISSFSAGEVSRVISGRLDVPRYAQGCKEMTNWVVMPQGPAFFRPGTRHIGETKNSEEARLIEFIFNDDQAYLIEAGSGYFRFFADGGALVGGTSTELCGDGDFATGSSWTIGSGGTLPSGHAVFDGTQGGPTTLSHAASLGSGTSYYVSLKLYGVTSGQVSLEINGEESVSWAVNGYAEAEISAPDGGSLTIKPDQNFIGQIDDVSIKESGIYEVETPYDIDQVKKLKYAQSGDEVRIAHNDIPPYLLTRYGNAIWTMAQITFTAAPTDWSYRNYPGAVGLYEQRCFFAGNVTNPQLVVGSRQGSYNDFTTGINPDDAIAYTIAAADVNQVHWLREIGGRLFLGSNGSVWSGGASSSIDAMTPENFAFKLEHGQGVADVQGLMVLKSLLSLAQYRKQLLEYSYDYERNGYVAVDLTLLAEHIGRAGGGFSSLGYAASPYSLLWGILEDGTAAILTYYRNEKVVAWAPQQTDGEFESVCVIPGSDRDEVYFIVKREINGATKRFVELWEKPFRGSTVEELRDAFYVDCGLTFYNPATISGATQANPVVITSTGHPFSNGEYVYIDSVSGMTELNENTYVVANAAANTFELTDKLGNDIDGTAFTAYSSGGRAEQSVLTVTGLDHLEGKELAILADGSSQARQTVSGGSVTLVERGRKIQFGLPYTGTLIPNNFEVPSQSGTSQGRISRSNKVVIRYVDSVGGKVGGDLDHLYPIPFRDKSTPIYQAIPPYTGDKVADVADPFGHESTIVIVQDEPYPMTVTMISPLISIFEGLGRGD